MNHKVFISYSTKDADIANAVCKALETEDIPCWIAPRDILPGEEYADAIIEALNNCQLFLVILSEESNSSPQVRREVERAVSKNLSILTFRIDNTILSKAMEYYLSNRHWLDASKTAFSKQLESLLAAVQKLLTLSPIQVNGAGIPEPVEVLEPILPVTQVVDAAPAPLPPSKPARVHKKSGAAWILGIILIILFSTVGYFGFADRMDNPLLGRATATNAPILTATIDYIATMQAINATSNAMSGDAWIQGFAEPIRSQVASRSPDFQDDFSNPNWSFNQWTFFNGSNDVKFENGKLVITATHLWNGVSILAPANDFVAQFNLTLAKVPPQILSFGLSFRGDAEGETSNNFSLNSNGWCGFGYSGPGTNNSTVKDCQTSIPNLDQTAKVTVFVQGDQAAAYVNDQPMVYIAGALNAGNRISIGTTVNEGTAKVSIDDLEIWSLSK